MSRATSSPASLTKWCRLIGTAFASLSQCVANGHPGHSYEVHTRYEETLSPPPRRGGHVAGIAPSGRARAAGYDHQWSSHQRYSAAASRREREHRDAGCWWLHRRIGALLLHRLG